MKPPKMTKSRRPAGPSLFGLLKPYRGFIVLLALMTVLANTMSLAIPKMIALSIDAFTAGTFMLSRTAVILGFIVLGIFVFTYLQSLLQTYTSERVARDLRTRLAAKISVQEYAFIQRITPGKLLTNLTSDIDAVKTFVSMAVASIVSSGFLIIGASILLLTLDWKLALIVLCIVPVIGITFFVVMKRIRALFIRSQEAIDWLNKVINESILGAALIRILNSQQPETQKFLAANTEAMDVGLKILNLFASLIPVITFAANIATLSILLVGGRFVINGDMTIGSFTAFNSYLGMLIFPMIVIGFMSNVIARASASYARVHQVLDAPDPVPSGTRDAPADGAVTFNDVSVVYGEKTVLKDVTFTVTMGSRTAIIGPTAAGKTQLLYLLAGLIVPAKGTIAYAGVPLADYDPVSLHARIGFVFQDSSVFNLTVRENIAFSDTVTDASLKKAIDTAELRDFVDALPEGLDTVVSERGTSLSGGQKQRLMLARALALEPSVLLLDDFTARVDAETEQKILHNIRTNYPGMTIISVTQKIAPIEHYDQILLLMEGDLLAKGTHAELLTTSPEYVQIADSQRSTSSYELQAE